MKELSQIVELSIKDFGNLGSKQSWKVEAIYWLLSYVTE